MKLSGILIRVVFFATLVFTWPWTFGMMPAYADEVYKERGSPCGDRQTTICTIEIWLSHKHKKNDEAIRKLLKENSLKVIRKTIQYWRAGGGHPPKNIAIGKAISAKDARFAIDLALLLNDRVEQLVIQALNPPHYVAVGTSAWDEKSLIPITSENLQRLRDPALGNEQFQKLYLELTGEEGFDRPWY